MSTDPGATPPPGKPGSKDDHELGDLTEEELRAAYEAELQRIRVEDVVVQTVISLLNLGARKAGLAGGEEEPDFDQGARRSRHPCAAAVVSRCSGPRPAGRDALSQLQKLIRGGSSGPAPAPAEPGAAAQAGRDGTAHRVGASWYPAVQVHTLAWSPTPSTWTRHIQHSG